MTCSGCLCSYSHSPTHFSVVWLHPDNNKEKIMQPIDAYVIGFIFWCIVGKLLA